MIATSRIRTITPETLNPQVALINLQAQLYHETRHAPRPVRQLMTGLLDRRNLEGAWDRVRKTDGAATPGIDGVTARQISDNKASWLSRLADDLYHQQYRPAEVRWIDVPKTGKPGEFRKIGVLTLRDRVVHAALKQVLEPLLEPIFLSGSFGFRPGRSVPGTLHEVLRVLSDTPRETSRFRSVAQLDVASCFDTIDHGLLLAELGRHVSDPDFLALMQLIINSGGQSSGMLWWKRACGLIQGSSLSPILCNLALHPLDVALNDFGQASQEGIRAFRYADDLLILGRDDRTTDRAVALTRQVLRRLQQDLRSGKTSSRSTEMGVQWLGVRIQPRSQSWLGYTQFGYVIPDEKVLKMIQRLTEMTTPPSEKIDGSAVNLSRWLVSLNDQLRDWRQAYLYADNAPEVFRALDEHVRNRVSELIHCVTGARWNEIHNRYRARLPRGFWTWEYQGARLTVLSSLAPHAPARLTRQPGWMRHQPKATEADLQESNEPLGLTYELPEPTEEVPAKPQTSSDRSEESTDKVDPNQEPEE